MIDDILQTPLVLNDLLTKINYNFRFNKLKKIYIAASGSSRNAVNTAKYYMEKKLNIPVIVEFAGELTQRHVAFTNNDQFIALSQSGETADVLSALKKAKSAGCNTFAITNNENSTIHNLADAGMPIMAGQEKSIPATKSFTCQLMCLYLLTLNITGQQEPDLFKVPEKIDEFVKNDTQTEGIAQQIKNYKNLILLGRGQNWGLAEEGALKIKETSYINATGYPTGEFMHGHIAVLNEDFPVISILARSYDDRKSRELAIKNTQEIKQKRNPKLIELNHNVDNEVIAPFITAVMLQLLAYKTAMLLGKDTDRPRGLEKTVGSE